MKYIDAEKLIEKLEEMKRAEYENCGGVNSKTGALQEVQELITSLQQEQPESTCKTCGFYENNCPFIRGKLIPYPNRVCKDYTYSVMKEQEQSEVDLEKEMDKFYGMYRDKTGKTYAIEDDEPCFDWKEDELSESDMRIARHFYKLGKARKEK